MKTKCYCIYCSKHPFYKKRNKFRVVTGWSCGDWISSNDTGKDVDCLEPVSCAFDELDIDPEDYEFPICAYGDGATQTGFEGRGYIIYAQCNNEDYEGD